jgi:Domain of unknown function (DUF4268)
VRAMSCGRPAARARPCAVAVAAGRGVARCTRPFQPLGLRIPSHHRRFAPPGGCSAQTPSCPNAQLPMGVAMIELGRLEPMDPRVVWPHEAHDFTPWLLDNADRLAEALGIDIELEAAEHAVGGYSLDLVGRDITNDAVLIVENQLAVTDHSHLGQVLTYAAGTGASTIVWIATAFREEHRQALDWLNESTGEKTHFFGIELQVVRIGQSVGAPLFQVAANPNDWQKRIHTVTRTGDLNGKRALYAQFWQRFLERVHAEHPDWTTARRLESQNWFDIKAPIRGCRIIGSFAQNSRLRHELYIDAGDAVENTRIFDQLHARRHEIETAYGRSLSWEDLPGRKACRVADYKDGCSITEEGRYDEYVAWFIDAGTRLRACLSASARQAA